eukprot:scaffold93153_cov31-Tisochrysis_lutea.AAC.1
MLTAVGEEADEASRRHDHGDAQLREYMPVDPVPPSARGGLDLSPLDVVVPAMPAALRLAGIPVGQCNRLPLAILRLVGSGRLARRHRRRAAATSIGVIKAPPVKKTLVSATQPRCRRGSSRQSQSDSMMQPESVNPYAAPDAAITSCSASPLDVRPSTAQQPPTTASPRAIAACGRRRGLGACGWASLPAAELPGGERRCSLERLEGGAERADHAAVDEHADAVDGGDQVSV